MRKIGQALTFGMIVFGAALVGIAMGKADARSEARFECVNVRAGQFSMIPFTQDSAFRSVTLYNHVGYCVVPVAK